MKNSLLSGCLKRALSLIENNSLTLLSPSPCYHSFSHPLMTLSIILVIYFIPFSLTLFLIFNHMWKKTFQIISSSLMYTLSMFSVSLLHLKNVNK